MSRKTQKKLRKLLTLVSCAVLLVCVTIGATVAYLTSTKTVTNTFTVGKVDIELTEAAITQDETTKDWIEDPDEERVTANNYHLLPGISYAKDPTVTVKAGSEEAYIRVLVSVTESADLDVLFAKHSYEITDIVKGLSENWQVVGNKEDTANDVRTYELRYKDPVDASSATNDIVLPDVFKQIVMPGDITNDELKTIDGMEIKVVAQAIQADGFATADAAWAAFK